MTMEWPEELLNIFEDPLLAAVHPKAIRPTPDNRRIKVLLEITEWCEANGNRQPQKNGATLKEKMMATSLAALRRDANEELAGYDRLNILTEKEK